MKRAPLLLLLAVASTSFAQNPASAQALVSGARKEAAQVGKTVFVRFTASWCGWCHKMDGVLTSPKIKPIWDKYFVSQPIVVLENGEKEKLENPGGEALMEAQGGKDQGIPYFYFADAKSGKTIATSMRPPAGLLCDGKPADKGGNVGCPYAPEEVAYFMDLLKKAAPKMTSSERAIIEDGFRALSKKG